MSDKTEGTCGGCLRVIQLRGDQPIRHGFRAVGVRHGSHGGWHTGPCVGIGYPHLGISTAGTEAALKIASERLANVRAGLDVLAGNPDLTWYPHLRGSSNKVRGGLPDTSRPVTLRHGDVPSYANDGRPSYAYEHRRRVAELTNQRDVLERAIAEYERVLATWSPDKYPVEGAAAKVETTHLAMRRRHARFGEWTGVSCRLTRPGHASDKMAKTDDATKVTCKACKKQMGFP